MRTYSVDEHDIRMVICLARVRHVEGEIWFVDESESFIEELKNKSGISEIRHVSVSRFNEPKQRPEDRHSGEAGLKFAISDVVITGDAASAWVSFYASPTGANWGTCVLRKKNGQWLIEGWKSGGES